MVDFFPHINASLNGVATLLLLVGYWQVRRGQLAAHKATMLSCFGVSVVFLICYLIYHAMAGSKRFPDTAPIQARITYFTILITHVILAALVPFLAVITIYLGLTDRRAAHRRLARWTFPIWLYVSVTGVLVYLMLYHLYLPNPAPVAML